MEMSSSHRPYYTTKSFKDGFVIKTDTDFKWEKYKYKCEMAQLAAKYGSTSSQVSYYYRKKLKEIK